jgi:hypothetical protein
MKYIVSVAINGRVDVEVEANSFQEAKDKARIEVYEIDSGEIDIIGCDAVNAEDENGKFIDY